MSARRRRWGRSTASQAKTSSSSDCATKSPSTGSSPAIAPESQISTTTAGGPRKAATPSRSEEHTSELQSLMRISYAVFCLKKKKKATRTQKCYHTTNTSTNQFTTTEKKKNM